MLKFAHIFFYRAVLTGLLAPLCLIACSQSVPADLLFVGGMVYSGDGSAGEIKDIAIRGDELVFVGQANGRIEAKKVIDATDLIVAPGFIDPHTHSLVDLQSSDEAIRENANYRLQGVTTVFNGNDGYGTPEIAQITQKLLEQGIGTNTAFLVGHGKVRQLVMGNEDRAPSAKEMDDMKALIESAMQDGAFGLSTGLFYAPGSFADTQEVIELAKIAAQFGGLYDSHIRDESTYNIGLEAAVEEVLEIAREAETPVHISHIKALGVDVWGKSMSIIEKISSARANGLQVSADQYPWQASGTRISNALLPRWVKAGTPEDYMQRLNDPALHDTLIAETTENLRRRGGAGAILITENRPEWKGKTLEELAEEKSISPVEMALEIAQQGDAKIASFNMHSEDIENFMLQDWVMTSSDGDQGHPRKYASYPRKFETYVRANKLMSIETFLYRSSGLVAETFGLCKRGFLREGYKADVVVIDPENFKAQADFHNPERLSTGVAYLTVNGMMVVENGQSNSSLPGKVLKLCSEKKTNKDI